jgi:hypothetical protein
MGPFVAAAMLATILPVSQMFYSILERFQNGVVYIWCIV